MSAVSRLVYWIFLALSLIAILLAIVLREVFSVEMAADIAKDIGVVLGSVTLLNMLWGKLGGEPLSEQIDQLRSFNELARDADQSGLIHIFVNTKDVRPDIETLIRQSKSRIDICGYTLYDLIENRALLDALKERIVGGVAVRFLQVSTESGDLNYSVKNREAMIPLMKATWSELERLKKELNEKHKSNVGLAQLKSQSLHISVRRFDDEIYVLHYIYSRNTPELPVYVIKGEDKPLFQIYMKEFDELYNNSIIA